MIRKRVVSLVLVLCVMLTLIGCTKEKQNDISNTESQSLTEDTVLMKDVVFMNQYSIFGFDDGYYIDDIRVYLKIIPDRKYEYDEIEDKNTLYAFHVEINATEETSFWKDSNSHERIMEMLKSEGIYILSDIYDEEYMYKGNNVIICTMDDLVRVFNGEDSEISKCDYHITPAMRPDFIEIFRQVGWTEEIDEFPFDWYQHKTELVQTVTGTEKQVTLTVEVEP